MSTINILNSYLNNVSWHNAIACQYITGNHADVWRINIGSNLLLLDNFLEIMQPDEIARSKRYYQVKDRNRYIVSRGALRNILGKYLGLQPASVQFEIGINKKPYIINSGIYYNISHSGDWILLAISNSEIGVDIELVNHDFKYNDVIEDVFSPGEVDFIKQSRSVEHFYLLWTRKEALIKATGIGINDNFKFIPTLDGLHDIESSIISSEKDWLVTSFKFQEEYVASVAGNILLKEIKFWDY